MKFLILFAALLVLFACVTGKYAMDYEDAEDFEEEEEEEGLNCKFDCLRSCVRTTRNMNPNEKSKYCMNKCC